ncbi:hypothetical protein LPJ73_001704 [Coemansia sp. RSA 2703]|nr:hypothetical protein LPJ73_001704 [Coemansia sp. RSA 2703]KAJ2371444.1 hypothetical protein IW150_004592 [Coemansia sp. RSA 2607]KAJ2393914.1 hypothetical protein GGI05_002271 [Coemansia sp. RSA 2603]
MSTNDASKPETTQENTFVSDMISLTFDCVVTRIERASYDTLSKLKKYLQSHHRTDSDEFVVYKGYSILAVEPITDEEYAEYFASGDKLAFAYTLPKETKSKETKPRVTKPEDPKPEESKPKDPTPEETKTEESHAEDSKAAETEAEDTKPEDTEMEGRSESC